MMIPLRFLRGESTTTYASSKLNRVGRRAARYDSGLSAHRCTRPAHKRPTPHRIAHERIACSRSRCGNSTPFIKLFPLPPVNPCQHPSSLPFAVPAPSSEHNHARYDGNGLRVKKASVVSGTTTSTVYLFSGSQVVAEYDNGAAVNNPSREYVYAGGQRIATIQGSLTTYQHSDHLSLRLLTDSNGNIAGQRGNYPYGETWYEAGTLTKVKFTTYERDAESGDDYAMDRTNISRLGRFSSVDPLSGSVSNPQRCMIRKFFCTIFCGPGEGDDGKGGGGGGGGTGGPPYFYYGPNNAGGGNAGGGNPANNAKTPCIPTSSLNWSQKAQLKAAQFYAGSTGLTFGFGAGADAGAGIGPKGSSLNFGLGGSASTLIVADGTGSSGFLNSASGGFAVVKTSGPGSWWGAGAAAGPSLLVSPNPISTIAGPSGSASAGGGAVLGAGVSVTTSGAVTVTFGVAAGAMAGFSSQFGTSQFIPFCKK